MKYFSYRRSRYLQALKASRTGKVVRVAALGTLVFVPVACANQDAQILSSAHDRVEPGTTTTTAGRGTTTTTLGRGSATTTTTTSPYAFAAGTGMNVTFTYTLAGGGVPKNPYIAVWVENSSGQLVKTVSLWYEQGGRGAQWLRDLRTWFSKSGGALPATGTGASRTPGQFTVTWDGTDASGNPVPKGDYTVWVEAAREKGPIETTSGPFQALGKPFSITLPDNGELSGLTASTLS